jgi:hypothetical protein
LYCCSEEHNLPYNNLLTRFPLPLSSVLVCTLPLFVSLEA